MPFCSGPQPHTKRSVGTNGTSPLRQLPDHSFTALGRSSEGEGVFNTPSFFVRLTAAGLHQQTLLPFLLQLIQAVAHCVLHWKVAQLPANAFTRCEASGRQLPANGHPA